MMQSLNNNNKVIIASAGSGKTTLLVDHAINNPELKILIVTYTLYNLEQIRNKFIRSCGFIPKNVTVQSWFSFLLQDCARPYQNYYYDKNRIQGICFVTGVSSTYKSKTDVNNYFFTNNNRIYTDKISEFACMCNEKSSGKVIERLSNIYDAIYIDEVQDLAGYDLNFVELLFQSDIEILLVGDFRQATFVTNHSRKNSQYKRYNIQSFFKNHQSKGHCEIEERAFSYRCNQLICNFSDLIYPEMANTESRNTDKTKHDGMFVITKNEVDDYIREFSPVVLRNSKRVNTLGHRGVNFGISKGLTFDRVLIFPTKPIQKFLETHNPNDLKPGAKANLYVAVTRAKFSVTFVCDKPKDVIGCTYYNKQETVSIEESSLNLF